MLQKLLVNLVIIGKDLKNNLSVALLNKAEKYVGIFEEPTANIDETAVTLAQRHIKAPLDWYELRRNTFLQQGDKLYLIYTAILPNDTSLKGCEWVKLENVPNVVEDADTALCVSKGLR